MGRSDHWVGVSKTRANYHAATVKLVFPFLLFTVAAAAEAIRTQDERGAWTEPGFVRNQAAKKVVPVAGIIRSETFIKHVEALSRYLSATR